MPLDNNERMFIQRDAGKVAGEAIALASMAATEGILVVQLRAQADRVRDLAAALIAKIDTDISD